MTREKLAIGDKVEYNNIHTNYERRMDMNFTFNVHGQLQSFNLPEYKALWPLFETVVNSIQSIEDSENKDNGKIFIKAERKNIRQDNLDGTSNEAPFISFWVKDNGMGFDEKNYKSFCEAYSTFKLEKGCKGIGRFLWLKAFNNVHVVSKFKENEIWFKRDFNFSAKDKIYPEENMMEILDDCQFSTEIKLENCLEKYVNKIPLSIDALGKRIIEHCLLYFLSDKCPEIILMDSDGEEINLNKIFNENIRESLHRDELTIKGQTFTLYHIRMKEGNIRHELHLCANSREVRSIKLSKYITNLQGRIKENVDKGSFYYQGYLLGTYLDKSVNLNRTAFDFEDDSDLFEEQYITESELINSAKSFIESYLHDDLLAIKEQKRQSINEFVQTKKPQYRYLLRNRPSIYDNIPAGIKEDALDLELYKESEKWASEVAQKAKNIETYIKEDMYLPDDFQELFDSYCQSISDISQASLSEYVIRRKSILDLLEKGMKRKDDGGFNQEKYIHNLIYPMRNTSNDIDYMRHNLWLVDERLSYCAYISSDIPFDKEHKRPDILILDNPIALSETKNSGVFDTIILVELKRPMRDDYSLSDNPIAQLYGYIEKIMDGKAIDKNGRTINTTATTKFYVYAICDITPSLEKILKSNDFKKMPDSLGRYLYHTGYNAYVEIIPFDKLLNDAIKRNQILFDKLFQPNVKETLNGKLLNDTDAID